MANEKHLSGVDHRKPPTPYPAAKSKPLEHPAFAGKRPEAIHHLDPSLKAGTPLPTSPAPKATSPAPNSKPNA